jgi:hypothetical protein
VITIGVGAPAFGSAASAGSPAGFWVDQGTRSVRRTSPRPDHSPRPLIERLNEAARIMNPFLATAAVVLMLLNFACAVSLINWQVLPATPSATACAINHSDAKTPTAFTRPAPHGVAASTD